MGVDLQNDLKGDAAAVGPYVVANIGLPVWLIIAYTVAILAACLSTLDAAFIGTSAVTSVDIVKRLAPNVTDRALLMWTRTAVLAVGLLSVVVILSGVDFVTLVLTTYALKTSVLLPLIMAVFWNKVNGSGIFWGIILAIVIGMPIFFYYGEFAGTFTIILVSLVVPVAWTMLNPQPFDPSELKLKVTDLEADRASITEKASIAQAPAN
jgi:Na+/proline symporter